MSGMRSSIILMILCSLLLMGCFEEKNDHFKELSSEEHEKLISRGKELTYAFACMNCHKIPGLVGTPETVGPPLKNWKKRKFIAGKVANNPQNLTQWLLKPHRVDQDTTMPKLKMDEEQARAISAYLFSLEED